MGADQIIGRRGAMVRWAPAVLAVASTLVLITAAAVTGDVGALPVTIATCLVTAAAIAALLAVDGATISPTALVISSPLGRRTIPWPDIEAVQVRGTRLWVMTGAGWYALPLAASTPACSTWARSVHRRPARARGLDRLDRAPRRRLACRGTRTVDSDHGPPWPRGPAAAGREPVVVAAGVVGSLATTGLGVAVGGLVSHIQRPSAPTSEPSDPWALLWFNLFVLVTTVAVTAAVHRWTRVAIDDETVHVRTLGGTVRIPRASILSLRGVTGGLGGDQRLAIDHGAYGPEGFWYGRTTRLPAPTTSTRSNLNDPEFYAKWAWLHDELALTPAPSLVDDAAT